MTLRHLGPWCNAEDVRQDEGVADHRHARPPAAAQRLRPGSSARSPLKPLPHSPGWSGRACDVWGREHLYRDGSKVYSGAINTGTDRHGYQLRIPGPWPPRPCGCRAAGMRRTGRRGQQPSALGRRPLTVHRSGRGWPSEASHHLLPRRERRLIRSSRRAGATSARKSSLSRSSFRHGSCFASSLSRSFGSAKRACRMAFSGS